MRDDSLRWVSGARTPSKVWITRVWNTGTWQEWQDMKQRYSHDEIVDAVLHPLQGVWTKHGKVFAEAVCNCRMEDSVLCSYDV